LTFCRWASHTRT